MFNFTIKTLAFILTLYIISVIVFKENYTGITHFVNLVLLVVFTFLTLISRDRYFKFNQVIMGYTLFVILTFASSFWSLSFVTAALRSMQLVLVLINVFIIYNIIIKYNLKNAFLKGILFGSFVNFILILGIVHAPFEVFNQGRAMGTLGNANLLAIVMIISILVSIMILHKGKKEISNIFYYYQYINIFLSIYMIVLTVSKKGILFGSILILVYFALSFKNTKDLLKILFVGTIITAIFLNYIDTNELKSNFINIEQRFNALATGLSGNSEYGSTGERLYLIKTGLNNIMNKPLFGHGIANFSLYEKRGKYSHNNYIEILFGVGLVGLLLYYSMFFFILKKIFNMEDLYMKIILTIVIMNILLVDMAFVSYGEKFHIYVLLILSIIAEEESSNVEREVLYEEKN